MFHKKLSAIAKFLNIKIKIDLDYTITNISSDSRLIKPQGLFLALSGDKYDGNNYINIARENGAVAVLTDKDVKNLQVKIPELAKFFYNFEPIGDKEIIDDNAKLNLVGITGTNGKTSISYYIAQILGQTSAIIGTLGIGRISNLTASELTTPDVLSIYHYLAKLKEQQVTDIAMEVSSHALLQQRISGLEFAIGVFTNLTPEHLDYHFNMENYYAAKKKLFTDYKMQYAIINIDDQYGHQLWQELIGKSTNAAKNLDTRESASKIYSYSLDNKNADIYCENINIEFNYITAKFISPWGQGEIEINLLGEFNLSNVIVAISCAVLLGIPLNKALQNAQKLTPPPGRMEIVHNNIVIDYAHTPDAIAKALKLLKANCQGKLWTIFGCGGNRDKPKRPRMLQQAVKYSDKIIITQDNPRNEDPKTIIWDMLKGTKINKNITIELDRKQAIKTAIAQAKPNDIIYIAGKGHENFQIIGNDKIPFSDKEIVLC